MVEDKNLFGRLDDISLSQDELLNEIKGVNSNIDDTKTKIAELEEQIAALKSSNQAAITNQTKTGQHYQQPNDRQALQIFLKNSKKSLRWFGNKAEFGRSKSLAVLSLFLLIVLGIVNTVVSCICFKMYSTFTFFENVWLVFGIIILVFVFHNRFRQDVNDLSIHTIEKHTTDEYGMKYFNGEKLVYKIFRWIAIISVVSNIICIWSLGKQTQVFSTIMEILYLGAIIFAFFAVINFFAQYSIPWLEGKNLTTGEAVTFVLMPGSKQLMTVDEVKKKVPFLFE